MGEHGAFRRAGGPAGVLQDGDILVRIDRDMLIRAVIVQQLAFRNDSVGVGGAVDSANFLGL